MDENGSENPNAPRFLISPAITALKQEARDASPQRAAPMERSLSEDIREEREDLKEAAEQTLNVIVDLELDGRIKWVSPSWKEVIGTSTENIQGRQISDIVLENESAFDDAIESMKADDSRSRIVRFSVETGPESVFWQDTQKEPKAEEESEATQVSESNDYENDNQEEPKRNVLSLEGQGIMVYDQPPAGESHVSIVLFIATDRWN